MELLEHVNKFVAPVGINQSINSAYGWTHSFLGLADCLAD
jgi:hypothetical protein